MFLCLSGLGRCCGFLVHCGCLLLRSGGLQSHLIHRGGCQLCSGGLQLCLIHCGGCQLCSGGLQFHSGSILHWLCLSPLSPHEQGLPTLHGPSLHYSPVLFQWERLEATPWGGAMSRSVSWLTTRGTLPHSSIHPRDAERPWAGHNRSIIQWPSCF